MLPILVSKIVSIHAPVKVRLFLVNAVSFAISFNSRTREGATFLLFAIDNVFMFQFTHP